MNYGYKEVTFLTNSKLRDFNTQTPDIIFCTKLIKQSIGSM